MRLGSFRLERYGPFEQLDLPLDPRPGRVNLIVAPNGYGKSVIRRSIGAFLFGIDARTPMSFRFGTERMRLLADVVQDGKTRSLVRRKGNGNTLAYADGAEVPPEDARRLLGGADETVFQELFGLDTTLLRSGGRDLIRSQGRLGQVLFAAGGGTARVRDLLAELERKRDELGRATIRHRSRPIWGALSNWEHAGVELRRAALRPDGWHDLERNAAETRRDLETLLRSQTDDAAERDRLATIRACRPWLDRLRAAEQVLAETRDAPAIDEGFEKRWRDALEARVKCSSAAATAQIALQAARDARAGLTYQTGWIAAENDIKALADLRGQALGAEADLPGVQRQHAIDYDKATSLRRNLGWPDGVPLPPATVVKDAQQRLQRREKLLLDAAAAEDKLADTNRDLAATQAELDGLPDLGDMSAVADLTAALRADGDPVVRLTTAARKLRDTEAALQAALGVIPDCPLSEAALAATSAPSEPRLDAAAAGLTRAEARYAQAVRNVADRASAIEAERARLEALERTARLPAPDALATARAHRDRIWSALCAPTASPDPGAAVALDRAIRDADAIADVLIAHGRELAEAAALRDRLAALETEHARDAAAMTEAAAELQSAHDTLVAIARAAGGDTSDIAALRAFLRAREAALTCRNARDAAAAEYAALQTQVLALGRRLADSVGRPFPDLAALGPLLAEADRRIKADQDHAAQRTALARQLSTQRAAHASAAARAEKSRLALTLWAEQWAPIAAALAHPVAETGIASADALALIEELRAVEVRGAAAQTRIEDMRNAVGLLAARVARLSDLAPELPSQPPIQAAATLRQRLEQELQQEVRCKDADQRIAQAGTRLAATTTEAEAAGRTLAGLRAALHAETDEAAEHQLHRARAAAAARADLAEAQRHLAEQGGGLSLDAIAARAAETTPDADAARLAAIEAQQRERLPQIDAARAAATEAAAALDQAGNGLDAAEAAQRREASQAAVARLAEEALELHAAHALLRTALDHQATGADQPLLTRIGAVFRTITGGVQAGVRIEDTRDGQTMVALEADGVTRKSLDQLSEGTADQLYLALRVAALEDYAAKAPPPPFIADDILQTFDDPRSEATLQTLVALSEQVQVIVLTHHLHVGDLAARMPGDSVQVMRLAA